MNTVPASPIANALALTLAHFLWQGLLVAAVYWSLHRATELRSARGRYAMGLTAFLVLAACPLLTFLTLHDAAQRTSLTNVTLPSGAGDVRWRTSAGSDLAPTADAAAGANPMVGKSNPNQAFTRGDVRPVAAESIAVWRPCVLLLWLAGVMLSGAGLLAGCANIAWLRWGRMPVAEDLQRRSQEMAQRLGLKSAGIYLSTCVREAAVVGFLRPVVLLPASWVTLLPPDVLEAVIAHELAHLRRHDVWVNLLQRIVETLFFYHPVVWWLSNRVRLEREMCCDQLAVHVTRNRGSYVMALEHVGRLRLRGTLNPATTFTGDNKMALLSRVRNVLQTNGKPSREPAWLVGLVALLAPLLMVGIHLLPIGHDTAMAQEREGGRSAEAEAGPRRSAERDQGARPADGEQPGKAEEGLRGFRPQTPREAALLQMITQLQREMAALRREVQAQRGGERSASGTSRGERSGDGDSVRTVMTPDEFPLPQNWKKTREGRVFLAYDKNNDEIVSLEEWLGMTNGLSSPERRRIGTRHFNDAEPSGDGQFTPAEFIWHRKLGQAQAAERARRNRSRDGEGEGAARGPRDGEGAPRSEARDGDQAKRGPRDAEGTRTGPRDGEGERSGPRDGEGPARRGPRDGEGARSGPRDGNGEQSRGGGRI